MRFLRAMFRLFCLLVLTVTLYLVWIGRIPLIARNRRSSWRGTMVGFWARSVLKLLGVHVQVRGIPPQPPFFLVSNHLSYLDIVVFQSLVPCVFLAKSEVSRWPVIGWLAREIGTLFIKRESRRDVLRANREIADELAKGDSVILFPEGTSSKGEEVLPFKSALFRPFEAGNIPIHHAAISYQTPDGEVSASESVCWWGDMTFGSHFFDLFPPEVQPRKPRWPQPQAA